MAKKQQKKAGRPPQLAGGRVVGVRLDASTIRRLEELAARMDPGPALIYGAKVSTASALRACIQAGLPIVERAADAR